jgi:hypothetical protein
MLQLRSAIDHCRPVVDLQRGDAAVRRGHRLVVAEGPPYAVAYRRSRDRFTGVLWLAWDKASFKPGGSGWAVVACLIATLCYGIAASYTKSG